MEDKEWDPRELFITIGMLIVEARLPELSAKGRIEGPHCPQYPNEDTHVCSYQDIRVWMNFFYFFLVLTFKAFSGKICIE